MRVDRQEQPRRSNVGIHVLRQRFDLEFEPRTELRLVRHVDVQVHALYLAAELACLVDRVVREVVDDRIEQISRTESDDQVDVVTDLTADPQVRRPSADQDRWIKVAPDVVEHTANCLV